MKVVKETLSFGVVQNHAREHIKSSLLINSELINSELINKLNERLPKARVISFTFGFKARLVSTTGFCFAQSKRRRKTNQ
jgi:hypothetical protein